MKRVFQSLRRWFEDAILDPIFVWALYRDVKPRKHFGASDVVVCVGSFAVFLFLVSSVLASSAPAPALHFAAHAKAHAEGKSLEQLADVQSARIASLNARPSTAAPAPRASISKGVDQ